MELRTAPASLPPAELLEFGSRFGKTRVGPAARGLEGQPLARWTRKRVGDPRRRVFFRNRSPMRLAPVLARAEVEVRLRARTRAGDVAPFPERALVAHQDERALERGSLGRVAGERVAVLDETSRDVPGGDHSALAAIRHDRERFPLAV